MQKTIITVVGKDTVGIIARVCTYLAKEQINILDISQTYRGRIFQHDDGDRHIRMRERYEKAVGGNESPG